VLGGDGARHAVRCGHAHPAELACVIDDGVHLTFEKIKLAGVAQLKQARNRCGRRAELAAAVHQHDTRGALRQRERPVESRVPATQDYELTIAEQFLVLHAVVKAAALVRVGARDGKLPCLKGADARGDYDGTGIKARATAGLDIKPAICARLDMRDFLPQMKSGRKGPDLLGQALDQLLRRADGNCRDVIDRLLRIQFRALPADLRQRIDDFGP